MATLDLTAFDAMLKEQYPDTKVESLAKKDRPLLSWLPRYDEFYGDAYVVPVRYEDPQGRSMTLSTAITNAVTSKQVKFVASSRISDYGVVKIDAETMKASSRDEGAFIRARQAEVDGMLRNLGKSLHIQLYRDGSGARGEISSVTSAANSVITLKNKSDVHNFAVGMELKADDTATGASPRTTAYGVNGRDVSAGTITMDANVVSGNSWAADDYLFQEGDEDSAVSGLAAWLPLSSPTSTAFFTVDRTADATRLGGQRVDNSGRSILENGQELAMLIAEEGGSPDAWFMSPRAAKLLAQEVGSKVERLEGRNAKLGFSGFTLYGLGHNPVDVIVDIGCPANRAYMLQRNTWRLACMGGVPHLVQDDGLIALRGSTTDDIEVRGRYWAELLCEAPGYNGVMSVATE